MQDQSGTKFKLKTGRLNERAFVRRSPCPMDRCGWPNETSQRDEDHHQNTRIHHCCYRFCNVENPTDLPDETTLSRTNERGRTLFRCRSPPGPSSPSRRPVIAFFGCKTWGNAFYGRGGARAVPSPSPCPLRTTASVLCVFEILLTFVRGGVDSVAAEGVVGSGCGPKEAGLLLVSPRGKQNVQQTLHHAVG